MKDKIEYDASHKAPALAARIVLFRLRLERHDNNPHSKLYNALIACARENGQRLKEAYACRTAGGYLVTSTDIVGIRQGVLRVSRRGPLSFVLPILTK